MPTTALSSKNSERCGVSIERNLGKRVSVKCWRAALVLAVWSSLVGCSETLHAQRQLVRTSLSPDGRHLQLLMQEVDTRYTDLPGRHSAKEEVLRAELWAMNVPLHTPRIPWSDLRAHARSVVAEQKHDDFRGFLISADTVLHHEHEDLLARCRLQEGSVCQALPGLRLPSDISTKDEVLAPSLDLALVAGKVYRLSDLRPGPVLTGRPGFEQWQERALATLPRQSSPVIWHFVNADWLLAHSAYIEKTASIMALAYHLPSDKLVTVPRGKLLQNQTLEMLDVTHDGQQWLFYFRALTCMPVRPDCHPMLGVYEADQRRLHDMPYPDLAQPFAQRVWLPTQRQLMLAQWLGSRSEGEDVVQIRTFPY